MAGEELCHTITMLVYDQALQVGVAGSPAYNDVIKAAVADLRSKASCLTSEFAATGGRQILSLSAGESITYSAPPMSQEDLLAAYKCALWSLQGRVALYRRTSARYQF